MNQFSPEIVLIAASTGGPAAFEALMPEIRRDFPVPILIVQHITAYFTEIFAQRLDQISRINVKLAEDGETVSAGTVYVAPSGKHMKLNSGNRICFEHSPLVVGVRPAADVLFESVADNFKGRRVLAVVLTGMGRDGKNGVAKLKEKKECFCIAQSERTCIVYGMPRAVAECGMADKIMDLNDIAPGIESFKY